MPVTRRNEHIPESDSSPRPWPNTPSNHIATPRITNPMTCFKRSIHAPGFGRKRSNVGLEVSSRYGRLIPAAMVKKIANTEAAGWLTAKPSVTPR